MTVSVVIPCYNGEAYLAETLQSVMSQTVSPIEILVIDDGSTDSSASLAEAAGKPVRVIRQPNQGESVARNRGMDEARGDWIAFVDADDLWLPRKLEEQLKQAEDGVVGVHTNVEVFGTQQFVSQIQKEPPAQRYSRIRLAAENCFLTPSALMVRRETAPRFVEWASRGEDMLFVLDLVGLGEIRLVEEPLTRYRRHPAGQSASLAGIVESHRALVTWLQERSDDIDVEERRAIDQARVKLLIDNAWSMKARRRWDEYRVFREYLEEYERSEHCHKTSELVELTSNRVLPPVVYAIRDRLLGKPV